MLKATAIHHRFGSAMVLDELDFSLSPGEITGLSGPSGVGKSTLGRILAGHFPPAEGRVEVDGEPVVLQSGQPCPVQYAPQVSELAIDPRWRISRVLRNGGVPDPEIQRIIGIRTEWENRFPAELSGGELARVSLARLLLPSTRYLICDEITAPLDALAAVEMMLVLKQLAERGVGILLISHNHRLLQKHTNRCVQLSS